MWILQELQEIRNGVPVAELPKRDRRLCPEGGVAVLQELSQLWNEIPGSEEPESLRDIFSDVAREHVILALPYMSEDGPCGLRGAQHRERQQGFRSNPPRFKLKLQRWERLAGPEDSQART